MAFDPAADASAPSLPAPDVGTSAYVALALAVGAGAIPLLTWTLVPDWTTGQVVASWALANLLASAFAVAGLITGVVARCHPCGGPAPVSDFPHKGCLPCSSSAAKP